MSTRRTFLAALAGLLPVAWLGRKVLASEPVKPASNPIYRHKTPSDPAIFGVPGETYFHAEGPRPPDGIRVFLDGVDVYTRCKASDSVGGWCLLYAADADGKNLHGGPFVHYGKVEYRMVGPARDDTFIMFRADYSQVERDMKRLGITSGSINPRIIGEEKLLGETIIKFGL